MRLIPYIIYLLLIGLHQVVFKDLTTIYGASINLAGFMVVAVATYKDETTTLWFGFFAGLVMAAGEPTMFGWHALILALVGLIAYQVRERLNLDSLAAKFLLMFGGIFLHNIAVLLIEHAAGFFSLFLPAGLLGAAYTAVLTLLFFVIKEGRLTIQKVKAIF